MSFNCASCAATKAVWGGRRHGGGQHCQHGDFHQLCRAALRKVASRFPYMFASSFASVVGFTCDLQSKLLRASVFCTCVFQYLQAHV